MPTSCGAPCSPRGYIIEGGRGRTAGKVLRFGHLGATDEDALNAGFDALLAALPA